MRFKHPLTEQVHELAIPNLQIKSCSGIADRNEKPKAKVASEPKG